MAEPGVRFPVDGFRHYAGERRADLAGCGPCLAAATRDPAFGMLCGFRGRAVGQRLMAAARKPETVNRMA